MSLTSSRTGNKEALGKRLLLFMFSYQFFKKNLATSLHEFFIATVTIYHKFRGLEQHKLIILYFCQKSSGLRRSSGQGRVASQVSRGGLVPCLFKLLAHTPWLMMPSLHLQRQQCCVSDHSSVVLSPSNSSICLPLLPFQGSYDLPDLPDNLGYSSYFKVSRLATFISLFHMN